MENQDYEPIWKPYVNREIIISVSGEGVTGYFNVPNLETGYVNILPHIVGEADEEGVYLERKVPLRLSLSLIENGPAFIRPVKDGFLEAKVAMLYVNNNNEVTTNDILYRSYAYNKIVVLPAYSTESFEMTLMKVDSLKKDLIIGPRGIYQPPSLRPEE